MCGVRWYHALLALSFIAFLLFIGSYKQYGITLNIPLHAGIVALFEPYCFSCLFHYISIDYSSTALPSKYTDYPHRCVLLFGIT